MRTPARVGRPIQLRRYRAVYPIAVFLKKPEIPVIRSPTARPVGDRRETHFFRDQLRHKADLFLHGLLAVLNQIGRPGNAVGAGRQPFLHGRAVPGMQVHPDFAEPPVLFFPGKGTEAGVLKHFVIAQVNGLHAVFFAKALKRGQKPGVFRADGLTFPPGPQVIPFRIDGDDQIFMFHAAVLRMPLSVSESHFEYQRGPALWAPGFLCSRLQ